MSSSNAIKGSALISALFIMTLVAIAATAMSTRLQLDIYRTRLTITSDELYLASQIVPFWAMSHLSVGNKTFNTVDKSLKILNFPKALESIYPPALIHGELYDLQAVFNINNLQNPKFHPLFFKLLENRIKLSNRERRALLEAASYWVSAYRPGRGHDDYLKFYSKQIPSYLPAYQPMQSVSELRLVKGVDKKIYQHLLPYVTALPELTAININTAPKELLMTLGNGLTESEANELIEARGRTGITDLKDIIPLLEKFNIPVAQIALESSYYLSVATVTFEDLTLVRYTILKRQKENGKVTVGIVRESLNAL